MAASDHLSPDQFIHRGMYLPNPAGRTPEDIHKMLFNVEGTRRTGTHWTPNWQVARNGFTTSNDLNVGVVLHATHPGEGALMDAGTRRRFGVAGPDSTHPIDRHIDEYEHEVPIQIGQPVHVHGLTVVGKHDTSWPPETRKPDEPDRHYTVDWRLRA